MTNQKKLIVYVGPYNFPLGGAAAKRIYGNCVALRNLGYEVKVVSGQISNGGDMPVVYKGIPVISLNERVYERLPRFLKHFFYFSAGQKAVKWLENLPIKPDAVILYSGYTPYLIRLLPWTKHNKVRLIFDTVEWYDAENFLAGIFLPYYWNIEFAMRYLLKKCDGLIVVSNYLNRYYMGNGPAVAVVPPTVNCAEVVPRLEPGKDGVIRFVYAGTPGKKDLLPVIVKAVLAVAYSGSKVQLNVAGILEEAVFSSVPEVPADYIRKVIKCYGLVSAEAAEDLVRTSDFSIVVRPNSRSVQAGFPTKFVESMSVGTPVIANLTSDLGVYLEDGKNGYVCKDDKVESLVDVINRAVSEGDFARMRLHARKTAETRFDVNAYASVLKRVVGC